MENYYLCPSCNGITKRESNKVTIKSKCDETGKVTRLKIIANADYLAMNLRKKYLKNLLDLRSFTRREQLFLNMAFEQGAKVVFNRLK